MDSLTNSVHQNHRCKAKSHAQYFGSVTVELLVNQHIVTGVAGKSLQWAYYGPMMKSELCKKHRWDKGQFEIIDCESFGSVNGNLDDTDRLQVFKSSHGALRVMRHHHGFKYSQMDTRPCCGNDKKTITHMLQCQLCNTDKWKEELQGGLKKADTGPQTSMIIIDIIKWFAINTNYKISREYDGVTQTVFLIKICLAGNISCKVNFSQIG